jgi:hypothetical protein
MSETGRFSFWAPISRGMRIKLGRPKLRRSQAFSKIGRPCADYRTETDAFVSLHEERPRAERALGAFSHRPAESARPTGRDTAVLSKNRSRPLNNKLLSLPREQFARLAPHLTTISLE